MWPCPAREFPRFPRSGLGDLGGDFCFGRCSSGGSLGGGGGGGKSPITLADIQLDYATATQTVFYVMAGVMAVCFVVALVGSPKGKMEEVILDEDESPAPEKPAAA